MMTFTKITKNRTLNNQAKEEKIIMREFKYILLFCAFMAVVSVVGVSLEAYIKSQNNVLKDLPPNTEIKLNNKSYIYTGKALIPLEDK